MNKRANNNSFLPRIMIIIALVAILGVVLWGYFGQDTVAMQEAREAYAQFMRENPDSEDKDFIYIYNDTIIVAIRNGKIVRKEYATEADAVKAATNNASVQDYTLSSTNSDKLYSIKLFDRNSGIYAVGAQKIAANAISMNVKVVAGGMIFAEFDIPAEAIADKQKMVEITIRKIDPKTNVTLGKNQEGFAYDIDVTNLVENNAAEIGVTINGPKGLAQGEQAITVYHNSSPISSKYNPTSGQVSFKTTHFSPYTFTYDVVPVSTLDDLRYNLQKKGGLNIRLTGNIEINLKDGAYVDHRQGVDIDDEFYDKSTTEKAYYAKGKYGDSWLYFGALVVGDKSLDLNGFSITYGGKRENGDSALFCVNKNASLTIVDSSNSGNGGNGRVEVKFDTYAIWSVNPTATVNVHDGIFVSDKYAGVTADTNAALLYSSGGKINVYGGYYLFDNANDGKRNGFNVIDQIDETCIWIYEGVHLSGTDYCEETDKGRVVLVGEADLVTGADSGASTREIPTDFDADDDNEADAFSAWHTVKGEKIELKQGLHTDKYIYRVGNRSPLPLGAFFNQVNAPTGKVSIRLVDILATKAHNDGAESVVNPETGKKYDKNDRFSGYYEYIGDQYVTIPSENYVTTADSWVDYTVQIPSSFTGPARLELYNTETNAIYAQLYVEVVAANNVSNYGELKNASSVLLNDITMSNGGTYSLTGGTLYGNGFTFDVKNAAYNGTGNESLNYLVYLSNANIDNVQIVGPVYEDCGLMSSNSYNRAVVYTKGTCGIYNSYISNAATPIRANNSQLTIVNTTLKGGSFANMDIRGGSQIVLDEVTTINQVSGNDKSEAGVAGAQGNKTTIGLGIVIWYEGTNGDEKIKIQDVDGDNDYQLKQYNYLASNQTGSTYFAKTAVLAGLDSVPFSSNVNAKFKKTINGVTWVNAGILSIDSRVGDGPISTPSGYGWNTVHYQGTDGWLCTELLGENANANPTVAAPDYAPSAQYLVTPSFDWKYANKVSDENYQVKTDDKAEFCYYDTVTQTIMIRFEKGSSFDFDPRILKVTKFGRELSVAAIEMEENKYTDNITFSEAGDYEITYTYLDENNYAMGVGGIGSYSVTHKKTIKVNVVLQDNALKAPTFNFNGKGTTTVKNGNNLYLSVTGGELSTTVGNQKISYPKIYIKLNPDWDTTDDTTKLKKSSTNTAYCPVFDGVVTISDNGTEYGSGTTDMAGGRLDMISNKESVLKWSSSNAVPTQNPVTKSGQQYFQSATIQGVERKQTTYTFEYVYTAQNGDVYHYYVGYVFPAKSGSSTSGTGTSAPNDDGCVTPDTLVTLADGRQVRVDSLTGKEQLLVWNLKTGKYEATPIVFVDSEAEEEFEIIHLYFSDGSDVKVISEHGFFDLDLGRYVYIDANNYADYVGHRFVSEGDISKDTWNVVTLDEVKLETEVTTAWSPVTFEHLCYYTNGVLSMPGGIEGLFNIFEVDTNTMTYDAEKMAKDIETYGLLTLEDFGGMVPQAAFDAFNGQYLNVAIGKGLLTWEQIAALAERYVPLM